ncbi:autophagy-related 10 [Rhodnius prolixus]|uniref:autophagy-related 10 n=1 Tax=Rhodnius prolixus TaxID=13249 RepID=UPI003D18996C
MGAITWLEFLNFAKEFISISDRLCDGWQLKILNEDCVGEVYLIKKELKSQQISIEQEIDVIQSQPHIWEYHILYSPSYSVPVFYFKVSNSEGRYLQVDEIISMFNIDTKSCLKIENVISQTEHPILRKPFYYLHPCRTAEFIFPKSANNKLISWLSCIATTVNLNLSLKYAKQELNDKN